MPLSGKGMLITSMDIDPKHEDEFNLWYDREHLAERVAIDGFLEARRWVAEDADPKYFATYSTAAFSDLTSPAYVQALANQTQWSRENLSRFQNMIRVVGRITDSQGQGRGAVLGVVRLRPENVTDQAREALKVAMAPGDQRHIIAMHLIESDPVLSKSLTEPDKPNPGAADWFVLVEGTTKAAVVELMETRFKALGIPLVSMGTYRLLWDLAKSDL